MIFAGSDRGLDWEDRLIDDGLVSSPKQPMFCASKDPQ